MDCRWCEPPAPIRERSVLVGRAPGRPVKMYIDKEPHEGEQVVIQRDDGKFRLLAPRERAHAVVPTYRIHSRRNCAPQPSTP